MYDFYDLREKNIALVKTPVGKKEWETELKKRIDIEKRRSELSVYYYRIYKCVIFPLPVKKGWDKIVPISYENINPYPWDIWLMWELRERWDIFLAAIVLYNDDEARSLLQAELEAALDWDKYSIGYEAYLGTAHFAMCLFRYIHRGVFDKKTEADFKEKSKDFLDKHFFPWFEKFSMRDRSDTVNFIHNIWVILVFSALALATEISHPRREEIERVAEEMNDVLRGSRNLNDPITEMAAYDAFTLDTRGEYIKAFGMDISPFESDISDTLISFADTAVPGRCDLLAPLGDVEPEMQFHALSLIRFADDLKRDDFIEAFCMIPAERLMASALLEAIEKDIRTRKEFSSLDIARKSAGSAVIKIGKGADALMCAASTARWRCGHVHFDGGSIVVATKGRFIITDPGYQQYVKGDEREFTVGKYSHNSPIINGETQKFNKCRIEKIGHGYISLDLTECYELNNGASVRRVIFLDYGERTVTVADEFSDIGNATVEHAFTLAPDFSASVMGGDIVITDDDVCASISSSEPFAPDAIMSMKGSRGRTTAFHTQKITQNGKITFKIKIGDKTV